MVIGLGFEISAFGSSFSGSFSSGFSNSKRGTKSGIGFKSLTVVKESSLTVSVF